MIYFIIWIIGVIVAWFQIRHWNQDSLLAKDDYLIAGILSLLSWGIYPIYGIEWLTNRINTK